MKIKEAALLQFSRLPINVQRYYSSILPPSYSPLGVPLGLPACSKFSDTPVLLSSPQNNVPF